MFARKTIHVPDLPGMVGHFIGVALHIPENKVEIFDSVIGTGFIYLPELERVMTEILAEIRLREKMDKKNISINLIHPKQQIENDCGPLTNMYGEMFYLKKEKYIENLEYKDVTAKLRAHHKNCMMDEVFIPRLDVSIRPPLFQSTPRNPRKRRIHDEYTSLKIKNLKM